MIRRSMTALALAACTLAPLASFAASSSKSAEDNATIAPAKGNMVRVTLKNRGTQTQNLMIQGKAISIAANQEQAITVPAGTQVLGDDNSVKLTIVKEYNGATASLR